jgi:hypothetical protein
MKSSPFVGGYLGALAAKRANPHGYEHRGRGRCRAGAIPPPPMMPRMAASVVVRFDHMPITRAGKFPTMARENAHPTIAKMSAGLVAASVAAPTATKNSRTRATVSRRIAGACGSSIL